MKTNLVDVSAIVDRQVRARLRVYMWGQVCEGVGVQVRVTVKERVWAGWNQVESVVRFQFLRDLTIP